MSMISGLIDELNKSADEWNASNMFELARMCREAADTILELRDDLQRANAENAKLRELVRLMVRRHTPISPCKNIPCGECPVKDECDQEDALMRELGVEVDG